MHMRSIHIPSDILLSYKFYQIWTGLYNFSQYRHVAPVSYPMITVTPDVNKWILSTFVRKNKQWNVEDCDVDHPQLRELWRDNHHLFLLHDHEVHVCLPFFTEPLAHGPAPTTETCWYPTQHQHTTQSTIGNYSTFFQTFRHVVIVVIQCFSVPLECLPLCPSSETTNCPEAWGSK